MGLRRVQTDDGNFVTVPLRRVVPRAGLDVRHGLQSVGSPPPPDRAFTHSRFGPPPPLSPPPPSLPSPPQQPHARLPPGWGPSRPPQPDEATGLPAEWLCYRKLSVPHLPRIEWLRKSPDSVLHEHLLGSEPHPARLPSILKCTVGEAELRGPLNTLPSGQMRTSVCVQSMEDMAVRVRGLDVAVEPASTAGPSHVEFAVLHRTRMRFV